MPPSSPPQHILVLAAWEPELAVIRAALAERPGLRRTLAARPVGVGLIEAGIGAARALATEKPAAVLFLGTAGVYPGHELELGEAAVVGNIHLLSHAVARREAYFPEPLPVVVATSASLRKKLGRKTFDLASPLGITRSAAAARRASATGCALENLEAFAVGRAAATAKVPFAAVVGVTNWVGPKAHAQWKTWAARAAAAAGEVILRATTPPERPRARGPRLRRG